MDKIRKTILFLNANQVSQELFRKKVLCDLPYDIINISFTTNIEELFNQGNFDLIVSEYDEELIKNIRAGEFGYKLIEMPVILFTGICYEGFAKVCLSLGYSDYIKFPHGDEKLRKAIQKYLNSEK